MQAITYSKLDTFFIQVKRYCKHRLDNSIVKALEPNAYKIYHKLTFTWSGSKLKKKVTMGGQDQPSVFYAPIQ
jgi:hypothetical protein